MNAKTYSDEQIQNFHQKYLECHNLSLTTFAKKNNLVSYSLRAGFKRLNLEIIPQQITRRKFPINENFFEIIDTEEKSYMLGFLYADGCNHEQHHKIEVSLAKQDEDILIKFSKLLLDGNINVKEYDDRVGLYLINRKISDDLKKLGCTARKTFILKFPDLPKHLLHHFVRGYFDGDGMLTIIVRNDKPSKPQIASFSIVSTKEMLEEIGKFIADMGIHFEINKRFPEKNNNNFTLRVSGNQQIKKVCDFLYKDATIYLDRKHEAYLHLLEMSKSFRKKHKL